MKAKRRREPDARSILGRKGENGSAASAANQVGSVLTPTGPPRPGQGERDKRSMLLPCLADGGEEGDPGGEGRVGTRYLGTGHTRPRGTKGRSISPLFMALSQPLAISAWADLTQI